MTGRPDDLFEVATTVGDGSPVDWAQLLSTHRDADPALLRELQLIARVAEVHRHAARSDTSQRVHDAAGRWGHLVVKEEIGAGSFGRVYRACDPRLERDVALKLYPGSTADDEAAMREGRLLARIRHPNVVIVHGVEWHGEMGLWLELIDGVTLAQHVRNAGPLGHREAALVGQDVCRALAAVHQAGLLHRDVKAQNVMRERGGRIVLMDFGIGRELRAARPGGLPGGTPLYMAPELFEGGSPSVRSDVYSVGVLLFWLVTGSYPVVASDRKGIEEAHRTGVRRLLRDTRADLPDPFVDVIERACSRNPADRYQTAGAMQSALAHAIGLPSEQSTDAWTRSPAPGRHVGTNRKVLALAVMFIMLAAGTLWWRWSTTLDPETGNAVATPGGSDRPAYSTSVAAIDAPYQIGVTFYRRRGSGSEQLSAGSRIVLGDSLFLEATSSRAIHLYVVNQDDRGQSYLLFPLPGQTPSNPLPGGSAQTVPRDVDWKVTSVGGREHFLVVASPEPLAALEKVFAQLPRPDEGRPVTTAAPLDDHVLGQLRGVGGLTTKPQADGAATDLLRSAIRLSTHQETARGAWMRQFTLENSGRR